MSRVSVLLADDHAVVAEALQALLHDSFDLLGTVYDGRDLVEAALTRRPDVIVTDLSMPSLNGLDAIRKIVDQWPDARFVVLTMHREAHLAAEAFAAGARGYVLKTSVSEELIEAIREVAAGRAFITGQLSKDFFSIVFTPQKSGGAAELTLRQREVVQLIAEGHTMKEVAARLNISRRTAETHKYEAMRALGVNSTAALVQFAVRKQLVDGETV